MISVIIGIGSNLGERVLNCNKALERMAEFSEVLSVSSYYETEPVGVEDQPNFINCAAEIATELEAHELLGRLKAVERSLGREGAEKWGPRMIDLDIIFYGDRTIDDSKLRVPHPEAHLRRFVLVPLTEIAPALIHPVLKVTVTELLSRLKDSKKVVKLDQYSTSNSQ